MELTYQEIDRLAVLTRLALTDDEKERLRTELGSILGYVERLAKVDTQGIPEAEGTREVGTGRPDALASAGPECREIIVKNFPDSLAGALRVPAVFEKPKK